jgi:hypothetical protein
LKTVKSLELRVEKNARIKFIGSSGSQEGGYQGTGYQKKVFSLIP